MSLRTGNRCAENVGVMPIIVAELKLGHVQRQILAADFVVAAHDAALNQRPEPSIVLVWIAPTTC